jgi:hypothetical protein
VKKLIYTVSIICLGLASCNKPTTACIELSQNSVTTGTEMTFTSCSEKALSFTWYFTGPAGAPENDIGWSEPIFLNSFSVPGTYTVELTAFERYSFVGDQSITTATFTVN